MSMHIQLGEDWERYFPLVKFAYNNSYQVSIGMMALEALYKRPCRSFSCWLMSSKVVTIKPEMISEVAEKVKLIQVNMKATQECQKSYVDIQRKDLEFKV